MLRYCAHCNYPLNDHTVFVEADSRLSASNKIKAAVAIISECNPDDVEIYNLHDEHEQPETVLNFECSWGGEHTIGKTRASGWIDNPVILFGDTERALAYQRWHEAMQSRAELEAQKALSKMKNNQ
ncbi:hypothetical protein L1D14_04030 [Vibrio tubiashii]|uniref:hypothetical protein n=1 Tax=Vibrio tubiashii TaxID=29498 RepID=UPI001EFDC703|nr:hypothetical protein [Vibrio tubiashii]MCG9575399.1 hypothetical protein [Vibrio tubiashii]